jgi:GH15 family glucan-1,4-alpha-glucosidase
MYGSAGERRLPELELDWLPGYEGAKPVRVGNAAVTQFQLDVYGEVMDLMHQARRAGAITERPQWSLERGLMDFLESNWSEPDEGIWEVRGRRRQFTHSKVMAWVAVDRAVSAVETFGLDGPVERWRALREEIHAEVCAKGYDADRGTFVQSYGSHLLDASLLMIPLVGFLPADDPRMIGTVDAIGRELSDGGFIARYQHDRDVDGLPEGEGVFLACSFWYADNLALQGRAAEAQELFERLLALRNDVGLLAEEYDTRARRQVGNFPQAFTHVSLVNSAANLSQKVGPAHHRQGHGYTTEWSLSAEAT